MRFGCPVKTMKAIICFAGFPGEEAAALSAEAARLNPGWECRLAPDAGAARAFLAGESCDALVVNMSALADGAVELLRHAGGLPHIPLRFVAGSVEDQSLIINSIGGPHHFVRQPFTPPGLVKNILRGLKLDAWLSTSELRALVPRLSRLPSLPSTYFNLLKEIESPSATLQGIASIIARDPVVTARLLQTVNSAAFSPAEKVAHPVDAVALLGVQTIKSLVLCLQVFSQRDEAREAGLPFEIIWEHSLLVAKFARLIALRQTGDAELAEDAFTVGLLHDVGRIVMAANLPKEYAGAVAVAREKPRPLHDEETARFGVNHARVGAYLLGLWGLPARYIEAAAAHHEPGQTAFAPEFSLLSAVHAANVFAHEMGGQTDGLPLPKLDWPYFQTLGLEDQVPVWRQTCTGEPAPSAPAATARLAPAPVVLPEKPAPSLAPSTVPPGRLIPFWLKSAAALAVILVALLAWLAVPKSAPSAAAGPAPAPAAPVAKFPANSVPDPITPAAPSPVTEPPKPVEPAPVAASVRINPLDKIHIQGILYSRAHPTAIIDKKSVLVGDIIDGVRVVSISPSAVILSLDGQQRVYSVR
jgi:HD-like signal output (HDOD) protein